MILAKETGGKRNNTNFIFIDLITSLVWLFFYVLIKYYFTSYYNLIIGNLLISIIKASLNLDFGFEYRSGEEFRIG